MDAFDFFSLCALAFFLAVFLGRTVMLARKGIRVFAIGAGKTGFRAVLEIGAIVLLWLFVANTALHGLHLRIRALGWTTTLFTLRPARIVGAALSGFGFFLFLWGILSFGDSWRIGIDKQRPDALVTGGAFGALRNPIFAFMDLYFIGTFLIYPTWPFLAMAAIFTVGVHFHIREEERFLQKRYGEQYAAYCRRVRRYGLC